MRSLLMKEYGRLELAELPVPEPARDEVLIRVEACGICGSDVHGLDGSTGRRIPPIVMGHEAAGVIAAVGADVTGYAIGDRVTFDSTIYCGECEFCRQGDVNLCDHRQVLGVSCGEYRRYGAFAEYVSVPARILYELPQGMPFEHAAMLEAVAVALHAVNVSETKRGQSALVIGAGMIGLLTMQAAKTAGCSPVFIADVDAERLERARGLGAARTFHGSGAALAAEVMSATRGRGVDHVLEAVGLTETIAAGIDAVRKGGTVTLIGNIAPEVAIPLQKVVSRQIRLQGSAASAGEYGRAIELVSSGKIRVQPLISAVAPLEQGARWFERLYKHEPGLMKVVLAPGASE